MTIGIAGSDPGAPIAGNAWRGRRFGMLHHFLSTNRHQLIARCRAKEAERHQAGHSEAELEHGMPLFLQQLIDLLQASAQAPTSPVQSSAARHGDELLRHGFPVDQVIHTYGDLCQAITELADETNAPISAKEFGALNRCLDDAIAAGVTEHVRQREQILEAEGSLEAEMRVGLLVHEVRNLLNTARLSFDVIKRGNAAINGTTSALHDRALRSLSDLVDRTVEEVRLSAGVQAEPIQVGRFIQDVERSAALEADAYGVRLRVRPIDPALAVRADRQILGAVLANLLQNAFKFTRANGHTNVSLGVHQAGDRILIEVEDECGGLPSGRPEELLRPFEQRGEDRSGLGLGLTVCQRGVEANDGVLHVRNLPGKGCVFTVELGQQPLWMN